MQLRKHLFNNNRESGSWRGEAAAVAGGGGGGGRDDYRAEVAVLQRRLGRREHNDNLDLRVGNVPIPEGCDIEDLEEGQEGQEGQEGRGSYTLISSMV